MAKSFTVSGVFFKTISSAKKYLSEGITKGTEITPADYRFNVMFELFVDYCNGSSEKQWHVIPDDISHFRFGPKLYENGSRIIAETNCFWCVFKSEQPARDFSLDKAITWKANLPSKNHRLDQAINSVLTKDIDVQMTARLESENNTYLVAYSTMSKKTKNEALNDMLSIGLTTYAEQLRNADNDKLIDYEKLADEIRSVKQEPR